MRRLTLRSMLLALGTALLAATPGLAEAAKDLCVTFDGSGEKVVAKNFGSPPRRDQCKALTGFMLPFFSISNGAACTSADGQTMFVEWTASNASSNGAAIWNATIPLPLPGTGTGNVIGLQEGVLPDGTTGGAFSAEKCAVAVPD